MGGEFLKHSQVRGIVTSAAEKAASERGYEIVEVEVSNKTPSR
ncbi:MAG: hypothetical protein ACLVLI_02150, partial [Aedoeadaptatus pacaensis]